ncbi:hypothetical protein [Pumilibacter muris]|nr:hypothetical protein [Pumilibacter muris]
MKCHKQIAPEEALHCPSCGKDYCPECAGSICDCAEELRYYS